MEQLVRIGDLDLCYEVFDGGGPALLLASGLSTSMLGWRTSMCTALARRGWTVIRFDNRDVGRSSRIRGAGPSMLQLVGAVTLGRRFDTPYTLSDMAGDAVGLLDHLGIDRAGVAGMSMGGMIAQTVAIEHPERVLALGSLMSTTGERHLVSTDPRALEIIRLPVARTRQQSLDLHARLFELLSGVPPVDAHAVRTYAAENWDRSIGPTGSARQLGAIFGSRHRARQLPDVTVPAWVGHGTHDPLIPTRAGRRTAELLPNAEFTLLEGMGHDMHPHFHPQLIDALDRLMQRGVGSRPHGGPASAPAP